jgi:hypothetical protein
MGPMRRWKTTRFCRNRPHLRKESAIMISTFDMSLSQMRAFLVGPCLVKQNVTLCLDLAPPPSPPCRWPMSALSTHLISAYTGLINPSALPPFASVSQPARTQPNLVISGPMSYNASMHGNCNAYPSFSHSQQSQPLFGSGYHANPPQHTTAIANVDLPAQTAQQIATLQAKLGKRLGPEYISQRPGPGGQGRLSSWKVGRLSTP